MTKIDCKVDNCSHNKQGTCYSNRINVGGKGAKKDLNTCCGSFLDKANYSTLTNNTTGSGQCDCLICSADTCYYNDNKSCNAETILVSGNNVNIYTETSCLTFRLK